jgi:glutamyl-tRNA synthetase
VGNAVNALLTHWWARAHAARLILRIDDFDTTRARAAYLEDIFDTLAWLGIRVDAGPSDPHSFRSDWSMSARHHAFRRARDQLLADRPDAVYVCRCSRRQLDPSGRCAAGCRGAGVPLRPGESVVRLSVPPGARARVGAALVDVPEGDHVIWRRDDLPAYQLGSVVADEHLEVTAIVRGVDLMGSSALQVHLAGLLPAPGFLAAELLHHPLLTAPDGSKLSKSAGAGARPLDRTPALLAEVHDRAVALGEPLGVLPA